MASKSLDVESVFRVARKIKSAEARAEYLDQICRDDPDMLRRAETLLRVHDEEPEFLESPPTGVAATIDLPVAERPGTQIGPYKLVQQLGEGGFGVVYLAEQQPMHRQVALKVIKPGMDSREVITRFEAERQALALMDHPNIAHVHDAGATDSGRPYFVMELVHGVPVTDYCDQHEMTIRERLELFVTVCQAVQHAHHKGIIHRDIKPSNVLVAENEDVPVPKVIDFGVAKATGVRLTDSATVTALGQLVGTPMYMSPEQAGRDAQDVDTRSDIYSLGVLLYELLTGRPPFDKERFQQANYEDICAIIREQEPAKPSTRITTVGEAATTISAHRHTSPTQLSRNLRGELDWIVMKALEKDRRRRYDTANDFAKDIQRYLGDQPVEAGPPSKRYRFAKFARRNRAALITATALLLTSAVALVAMTLVSLSQSQLADHQRELANQRLHVQQGVNDALTEVARLRVRADTAENNGESVLAQARDQAQRALALAETGPVEASLVAQVRQLSAEMDQQQSERQLLAALDRTWLAQADMDYLLGQCQQAKQTLYGLHQTFSSQASIPLLREALQAYGIRPGETPPQQCAAIINASSQAVRRELLAALYEWCRLAKPLSGIYLRQQPAGEVVVHSVSPSRTSTGELLLKAGDRIVGVRPRAGGPMVDTSHMTIWEVYKLMGSTVGTTAMLEVIPQDQSEPRTYEFSCGPIAAWLEAVLDTADEDPWRQRLREAYRVEDVAKQRAALEKLADDANLDRQPVRVLVTLAQKLRGVGAVASTEKLLRRAWHQQPNDVSVNLGLALLLHFRAPPPLEESKRYYTAAIALRPDSYGLRNNLGMVLAFRGSHEEAVAEYRAALRIQPDQTFIHKNLGEVLMQQGKYEEAIAAFREALRLQPDLPQDDFYFYLLNSLVQQQRFFEAKPEALRGYAREGLQIRPDVLGFGVVRVGATVEGSVRVRVDGDDTSGVAFSVKPPQFVRIHSVSLRTRALRSSGTTVHCEIAVSIQTDHAGDLGGDIHLQLGDWRIKIPVTAVILPRQANTTKVLIVPTPFHKGFDSRWIGSWLDIVRGGNFDVHYLNVARGQSVLRDLELSSFHVLLLGRSGLTGLVDGDVERIKNYLDSGGRVIVFAGSGFKGTVDKANKLLGEYGLQIKDSRYRRQIKDPTKLFELGPWGDYFKLQGADIIPDHLTTNIDTVEVRRSSSIGVTDKKLGKILVSAPSSAEEGFVAVGRQGKGEVIAVGQVFWQTWLHENPESDNSAFLNNFLNRDDE